MSNHDSNYLIGQLLTNRLSGAELDSLLAGLHSPTARQAYSDVLEAYFNNLLAQHDPPPEPDNPAG